MAVLVPANRGGLGVSAVSPMWHSWAESRGDTGLSPQHPTGITGGSSLPKMIKLSPPLGFRHQRIPTPHVLCPGGREGTVAAGQGGRQLLNPPCGSIWFISSLLPPGLGSTMRPHSSPT